MENETQMIDEKDIGIGTKEKKVLGPARVKIIEARIESMDINGKESKKVVILCKHPDRDEAISISSVKFQKGDKLTESGLWFNLDEEGLISKESGLAKLMKEVEAGNLRQLESKEINTILDSKGYLTFKIY